MLHFRLLCVPGRSTCLVPCEDQIAARALTLRSGPVRPGSPREETEGAEDGAHLWSPRSRRVLKVASVVRDVCFLVAAATGEPPHLRTVTLRQFGSVIDRGQPIDDRCTLHQEFD